MYGHYFTQSINTFRCVNTNQIWMKVESYSLENTMPFYLCMNKKTLPNLIKVH